MDKEVLRTLTNKWALVVGFVLAIILAAFLANFWLSARLNSGPSDSRDFSSLDIGHEQYDSRPNVHEGEVGALELIEPTAGSGSASTPQSAGSEGVVEVLDRILSRLRKGTIQYTAPDEVSIKGEIEIGAVIGVNITSEQLTNELRNHFPTVAIESDTLSVSEVMVGAIESRGFEFSPKEPVAQVVSNSNPTIWRWRGVPKEAGEQPVVVTMSARLKVNDTLSADRLVETWRTVIVVRVSWWDLLWRFLLDHIEWVWGSLLVPLAGVIWKLLKSKSNRSDNPSNEGS